MEVTKENFEETLPKVIEAIDQAQFVAIDGMWFNKRFYSD